MGAHRQLQIPRPSAASDGLGMTASDSLGAADGTPVTDRRDMNAGFEAGEKPHPLQTKGAAPDGQNSAAL